MGVKTPLADAGVETPFDADPERPMLRNLSD